MRKFLLITAFAALGFFSNAQTRVGRDHNLQFMQLEQPMVSGQGAASHSTHQAGAQRAGTLHSILHSQKIGSSGNLFTIIEGNCKMVDANNAINSVTFIHRCDNIAFPTNDIGQYRYDFSRDGGNTWTNNLGPITNNALLSDGLHNGRYPQGIIYNPAGNTIPDSAKYIYSGTWHNSPSAGGSGSWQGDLRGRGQLGDAGTTFDTHLDVLNNAQVAIATGLTTGAPGVFWNLNEDFTGTFASGSTQLTVGFIVEKGIWNASTQSVNWTALPTVPQTFITYSNSGSTVSQSAATSWSIAFDPSGKYGWVACLGDTLGNNGYQPMLWNSTDSGATWHGPYICDLTALPNVMNNLGKIVAQYAQAPSVPGTPASGIPTTAFEAALSVDVKGIPHLVTTVGNQIGASSVYSIEDAGYDIYDFTYNPNASIGACSWQALHLAKTGTFAGVFSSDAAPNETLQEHRPQISRSDDGSKMFFFWNTTDVKYTETNNTNEDNAAPNLFGKGLDVVSGKMTQTYNFTIGDSLWGGATLDSTGGVFGGAIMPTVGQHCLFNGGVYNIPLVLAQIDYAHNPPAAFTGSNLVPAAYWYINNINFPSAAFNQNSDSTPPVITLNGADTMSVLIGSSFTDPGATAYDCVSGIVTVRTVGSVDANTGGTYFIYYIATDSAGNTDTVVRTVLVSGIPVAKFVWTFTLPSVAQFTDQSTNFPTSWQWRFTSPTNLVSGTTLQNPSKTFNENGTWNVCLTATNSFGSSPVQCHTLAIVGAGINEVDFAQHVTLFPNPTNGKATISINESTSSDFTVSVTNMLGEAVMTPAKYKVGTTHVEMDLASLASGVYLVKIQSNEGSVVKHLILTQK